MSRLLVLYDLLLGRAFSARIRRRFELLVGRYQVRMDSVADIGCGTGLFVAYLCETGRRTVYGVDRSPEMLSQAHVNNQCNCAHFLLQDFRRLILPHAVDLITCFFDSLNYLITTSDFAITLRRIHKNLVRDGHLIFDVVTGSSSTAWADVEVERGHNGTVYRTTFWDHRGGIQTSRITVSLNGCSFEEWHRQRWYSIDVVAKLLNLTGFLVLGAHDFETLAPATGSSARVIFVARKMDQRVPSY
jgi:SAM-dependent methyltransferase